MQWSIDLLDRPSRLALATLALIDADLGIDAALVAVGAARQLDGLEAGGALTDIETLVRVALVQPVEGRSGRRLAMLETIRSVAGNAMTDPGPERLATAALGAVADDLARREPGTALLDEWSPEDLARLTDDLGLLDRVVGALLRTGRTDDAAALVARRRRGFALLGRQDLLRGLLQRVIDAEPTEPWLRRAQVIAGYGAYMVGDEVGMTLLDVVDALPDDDVSYQVFGYATRTVLAGERGDETASRRDAARAIERATASGSRALLRFAHSAASWAALNFGDPAEALDHATREVELSDDLLDRVQALTEVARAELYGTGEVRARALMQEAQQLARRAGAPSVIAETAEVLGVALLRAGDVESAARQFGDALRIVATVADDSWRLQIVASIAMCAVVAGDPAGTELMHHADATARARGIGDHALPQYLTVVAEQYDRGPSRDPLLPARDVRDLLSDARRALDTIEFVEATQATRDQ